MKALMMAGSALRRLARDRLALFFIVLLPVVIIAIIGITFGNAASERLPVGIADEGAGPLGNQLRGGGTPAPVPPHVGLSHRPAVERLQLGGQRDQQRLAVGRAHQLNPDRQPTVGEPGGHIDRRPAQQVPRPGHRACADHRAVGRQPTAMVEVGDP